MRIHISYQGLEKQNKKTLNTLIRERADKLEEKLGSLADHDPSLKGTFQKHGKHQLFRFGATLHLLHKIIAADEDGEDAHVVIRKVFEELERQAQRYKSRLKNEHMWKRKARRKTLDTYPKVESDTETRAEAETTTQKTSTETDARTAMKPAGWFDEIKPYLDDLYDFAVREITYLQATDDLRPDDLLPDELVDAVVVSSYEKRGEKPEDMDIRAWLHQLAIDILDEQTAKSHELRKAISLETVIPDEDIDTDLYEFYQPDDVLKLEDLIGAPETLPEVEASQVLAEQAQAQPAIAHLPRTWRRAALLRHASQFSVSEVAAIMRLDQAIIEDLLHTTARFLTERTDRTGLTSGVKIERVLTIRRKITPASFVEGLRQKFSG